MHKKPKDFRFITAGKSTILQNLSISVSKCLKLLLKIANTYQQYRIKDLGDCMFIIDNRDKVVKFLNGSNANQDGRRKRVTTWDFSTLYTKIPHHQLKTNIKLFVDNVFECKNTKSNNSLKNKKELKNFICCSTKTKLAYFSKSRSKTNLCFDKHELVEAVEYIIDNSYIKFEDCIYKQIIGIPMGTNCAPLLANIYLHVYEREYILMLVNKGQTDVAQKLCNVFRFQDDCIAINDDEVFKKHYAGIYPAEMILKPTNISRDKCTFLDLTVSIYRGRFIYYSYDKRRDFDFDIVSYPNLKGNIPTNQSYGVYTSQIVRFCDINQSCKNFVADVINMTQKFLKQGFKVDILRSKYKEFCIKYLYKWAKYNSDIAQGSIINKIFPRSVKNRI